MENSGFSTLNPHRKKKNQIPRSFPQNHTRSAIGYFSKNFALQKVRGRVSDEIGDVKTKASFDRRPGKIGRRERADPGGREVWGAREIKIVQFISNEITFSRKSRAGRAIQINFFAIRDTANSTRVFYRRQLRSGGRYVRRMSVRQNAPICKSFRIRRKKTETRPVNKR